MPLPSKQIVGWLMNVLLGGVACTPELPPSANHDEPVSSSMLWSVRLPGNAGIYNEGMIGLPVVNNRVLFHSTIFTDHTGEDNRLHALDVQSGSILWTFPSQFHADEPYYFDGKPYLYQSRLVTKMSAFSPYSGNDRILILDLNEGQKLDLIDMPPAVSRFSCRDVAGKGSNAWFVQEDEHASYVYKLNIATGDTARIVRLAPSHPSGRLEVTTRELQLYEIDGKLFLLLGVADYAPARTELRMVLVNAETGSIGYQKTVGRDYNLNVNYAVLRNSMIYYTCGRSAGCIDLEKDRLRWQYFPQVPMDDMKPGLLVQDSVVFLWGHRTCAALGAGSGRLLYERQIECANASGSTPYLFVVTHCGEAVVLDQYTGNIVRTFSTSPGREKNGFSTGCKPGIKDKKLFLFGLHNAYCFTF